MIPLLSLGHLQKETISSTWAEMETGSARAQVLVSASFVEFHLEHLLRSRLKDDAAVLDKVFENNGALRSFSQKIDVAYLLRLYPQRVLKELHTIRDVRNSFAHKLPSNQQTQSVRDLCANLVVHTERTITITADGTDGKPKEFNFASEGEPDPIRRYVDSSRFYVAVLSIMTAHPDVDLSKIGEAV
jgi:hypothetical protein